MFSAEIFKHSTGKEFAVKNDDVDKIKDILKESLQQPDSSTARDRVMEIIQPYLQGSTFDVKPVAAESIIESRDREGNARFKGGGKYVEKINENEWVKKQKS